MPGEPTGTYSSHRKSETTTPEISKALTLEDPSLQKDTSALFFFLKSDCAFTTKLADQPESKPANVTAGTAGPVRALHALQLLVSSSGHL